MVIIQILKFIIKFIILFFKKITYNRILKNYGEKSAHEYAYKTVKNHIKDIIDITKADIRVHGLENIPNEPVLYVSNHQSLFDPFFIINYCDKLTSGVAKIELKKFPNYSYWMEKNKILFLDRNDPREGLKVINEAARLIKEEKLSMFIFPEGTRSKDKKMLPMQRGSFKIAVKANCKIVPIAIDGSSQIFEDEKMIKLNKKINISFLKAIDVNDMDDKAKKEIHLYVQELIEEEINRMRLE